MEIGYFELAYEDIEQISQMEQSYFGQPWSESSIASYAEKGNTVFIVARREGTVVGYIAVLCILDEGNLVSIAVHDDYREMGIATELLDIASEMAMDRGVTSIHLEVREQNEKAIRLYEKEGFMQIGRRKSFYRNPEEDAILYREDLIRE